MAYNHTLSNEEKTELLRIARATLREFVRTGMIPPGKPHRESMLLEGGAFVTLHIEDQLRGCIGIAEADKPLYKTIQEMAVAASSRDPRFDPIREEELPSLTIEISVFGETKSVADVTNVEVGIHGVVVSSGSKRGLLLPQVATENKWDAETFLSHVCKKAGLAGDAWKEESASIDVFTAQVFSDKTHPPVG